MRFAMLICGDETAEAAILPDEIEMTMAATYAWFEKWAQAGKIANGGAELDSASKARTVRAAGVTDGPYMESKEVVGGFVLLNAESMDEAVEIASTWPNIHTYGAVVEVRPIVEH